MIHSAPRAASAAAGRYGSFSPDGREFVITDPRTPRPWANVIANPRVGLAVAQTGCGFSWIDNSQLAAIVRWQQDLAEDRSGRFLYLRDLDDGTVWSLAPSPCWPVYGRFACRHGLGYTTFETEHRGIAARWTLFVDVDAPVEFWQVEIEDRSGRPRRLELVPFLEWNCGTSPAPRREFQKLFLETRWEPGARAVLAGAHMWDVGSKRWGHWNTAFPYWSAFVAAQPVARASGDKGEFLGRYGDWRRPAALDAGAWKPRFGRHHDPVAVLGCEVEIPSGGAFSGGFALATEAEEPAALAAAKAAAAPGVMARALARVESAWRERLAAHRIETPEPELDCLANDWLRYQAISARLWGRAGYYQQSGAYGFRDQLQDSQVWLTIDPARCREQIALHAEHQFADGSVVHWWHPLTELGHVTQMTDDLLWLGFVAASYIKETGDFAILEGRHRFLDEAAPATLREHVRRALARVFRRTSERGLPFIGAGDWNDGLSAMGLEERGESVWLAQFLVGLLADWAELEERGGETEYAADLRARRARLVASVNELAWDGAWYRRGTRDDGEWIGSRANRVGRIFLNAQTWAVLHDVAPPERVALCLDAVERYLVSEAGALLLAPAYDQPDERIGYITRYAPGLRENGGVYTHAATWAIAAAAKAGRPALVARLLTAILPSNKDPERYWAEPYVLPGNVDGPDSPYHGRAGWTWYTGSAAWLPRVVAEWVLGVRPTWEGMSFAPCLPPHWPGARMVRPYRGAMLEVTIERTEALAPGASKVTIDGEVAEGGLLRIPRPGAHHRIRVVTGGQARGNPDRGGLWRRPDEGSRPSAAR